MTFLLSFKVFTFKFVKLKAFKQTGNYQCSSIKLTSQPHNSKMRVFPGSLSTSDVFIFQYAMMTEALIEDATICFVKPDESSSCTEFLG